MSWDKFPKKKRALPTSSKIVIAALFSWSLNQLAMSGKCAYLLPVLFNFLNIRCITRIRIIANWIFGPGQVLTTSINKSINRVVQKKYQVWCSSSTKLLLLRLAMWTNIPKGNKLSCHLKLAIRSLTVFLNDIFATKLLFNVTSPKAKQLNRRLLDFGRSFLSKSKKNGRITYETQLPSTQYTDFKKPPVSQISPLARMRMTWKRKEFILLRNKYGVCF